MAKSGSLQAIVKKAQPKYDFGTISHELNSNLSQQPFVLVEASWDCKFFRKMLNGKQVNLGIAEEKGKSGYHYVERIVQEVLEYKPKSKVIGIRDRDYTHYDTHYTKPKNIFMTDEHSLETMLIHSQSVCNSLEQAWNGFSEGLKHVIQDARHIARYYIFNILEDLKIDFYEEKMHLSDFSDSTNCCMKERWKEQLCKIFFTQVSCMGKSESDLDRRVKVAGFDNASDYAVCRGHDLLDTSYNTIRHGSLTPDEIMTIMISAYSPADFANTDLCKDLNVWAKKARVTLFSNHS